MGLKMNGNLQLIGVRRLGGHLQEETETWDKGGTQESIGGDLSCDTLHCAYQT